jgi:hypothetical protein
MNDFVLWNLKVRYQNVTLLLRSALKFTPFLFVLSCSHFSVLCRQWQWIEFCTAASSGVLQLGTERGSVGWNTELVWRAERVDTIERTHREMWLSERNVPVWTECDCLNGMCLSERNVAVWTECDSLNGIWLPERNVPAWTECACLNGM